MPNGLALCRLHHAAFDTQLLGIRSDYVIEVRKDVLKEKDGPMLIHGLQGFHGESITIPIRKALQPDRDLLATRYKSFRQVNG